MLYEFEHPVEKVSLGIDPFHFRWRDGLQIGVSRTAHIVCSEGNARYEYAPVKGPTVWYNWRLQKVEGPINSDFLLTFPFANSVLITRVPSRLANSRIAKLMPRQTP